MEQIYNNYIHKMSRLQHTYKKKDSAFTEADSTCRENRSVKKVLSIQKTKPSKLSDYLYHLDEEDSKERRISMFEGENASRKGQRGQINRENADPFLEAKLKYQMGQILKNKMNTEHKKVAGGQLMSVDCFQDGSLTTLKKQNQRKQVFQAIHLKQISANLKTVAK